MRKFLFLLAFGSSVAFAQPVAKTTADGLTAYRTARKLAEGGQRAVLVLGTETSMLKSEDKDVFRFTRYAEYDELKGFAPGVYDCTKGADGSPKMERRCPPPPPPAVPYYPPAPAPGFGLGFQLVGPLGNGVGVCVGRS